MNEREPANNSAESDRARLTNLARRRGVELQLLLLSEFAIERLLSARTVTAHATTRAQGGDSFQTMDRGSTKSNLGPRLPGFGSRPQERHPC